MVTAHYTQQTIALTRILLNTVHHLPEEALPFALTYPDEQGAFYGYDYREAAYGNQPGTRLLVDAICWAAAALVAIETGKYVGTKSEAIRTYVVSIDDQWSPLVEHIYELCKLQWHYAIPQQSSERQQLRQLCQRVLGFENHALHVFNTYQS